MKIYVDAETYKNGQEGQDTFIVVLKGNKIYKEHLGDKTCNEGELMAIYIALDFAKDSDVIYSDSQLAVNLVNGIWKAHKKHLIPYVRQVRRKLMEKIVGVKWIPREENKAGIYIEDLQYGTKRITRQKTI